MPLVTLTVRKPKTPAFKAARLDGAHAAVAAGVPAADRFQGRRSWRLVDKSAAMGCVPRGA